METIKKIWDWIIFILFKSVPVFIASCIGILLLAVGLLMYGSCNNVTIEPTMQELLVYQIEDPAETFPMEINITDDFSDNQIQVIANAAIDWNTFTKGKVVISLRPNWVPTSAFSEDCYKDYPDKTIWMKTGNEPEVVKLFLKYNIAADAFTIGNVMIIMNPFGKLDDATLYKVVLHELGHYLHLQHINKKYPALMNVTGNDGHFTNYDKMEFCYLYKCDWKQL